MLVLTRKPGQLLTIEPEVDLPPELPAGEMFVQGSILVVVKRIERGQVSLGIEAPRCLRIDRAERGDADGVRDGAFAGVEELHNPRMG